MTFYQAVHFWIDQAIRFVSPPIVSAEWLLCVLGVLLMILAPLRPWAWSASLADRFVRLAARKRTAVAICGVLPVIVRLAMLGMYPVPIPSIHDEFSHLLLGDTLAHGRMSNPPHPMWQHFESIHLIQQPTYSSMYPPAQGMFLAAGEVVFHEPWVGVLLSVGLMFAAICWMMQQWMPPAWALYGTLIAIARIGLFGPWIDSYLGGAVPAIGGALVFGSIPRLREPGSRTIHSFLFGLGVVILMNSRPFEGAVLSLGAFLYVLPSLMRRIRSGGLIASRAVWAPALILVACGFLFTGYYSWRVTGSPLKMPYAVNRDTYGWPENLAFLPVHTVTSRHKVLKDMYTMEVQRRATLKKWDAFVADKAVRLFENWAFFIGPLLTIPLLAAIGHFRDPRIRPLLLFIGVIAFLNLFQLVLYPYHLGPVVAIMFALVAQGLRWIYKTLSNVRPAAGYMMALTLPVFLLLAGVMKREADYIGLPLTYWERATEPHGTVRSHLQEWLSSRSRKQLVLVRYKRNHSPNQEWVYNLADIDASKVVWAREMDEKSDAELVKYYKDREVWLLQADNWPQHLVHYPLDVVHCASDINVGTDEPPPSPCSCQSESE